MTFHDFFINNEFFMSFSRLNTISQFFHDFWKLHDLWSPCNILYTWGKIALQIKQGQTESSEIGGSK